MNLLTFKSPSSNLPSPNPQNPNPNPNPKFTHFLPKFTDPTRLFAPIWSFLPFKPTRKSPIPRPPSRARFRPYVAKVPWHGGVRAFLSQLFPRYGHYCGPNWSSGKDGGSMLWDRRPIDWLDFCCYCHDIGYDTHDLGRLLKADLEFLECLEKPRVATKGGAGAAFLYRSMCITGLRNLLIPYRMELVRLQEGKPPSVVELMSNLIQRASPRSRTSSKVEVGGH